MLSAEFRVSIDIKPRFRMENSEIQCRNGGSSEGRKGERKGFRKSRRFAYRLLLAMAGKLLLRSETRFQKKVKGEQAQVFLPLWLWRNVQS